MKTRYFTIPNLAIYFCSYAYQGKCGVVLKLAGLLEHGFPSAGIQRKYYNILRFLLAALYLIVCIRIQIKKLCKMKMAGDLLKPTVTAHLFTMHISCYQSASGGNNQQHRGASRTIHL